MDKFFPTCSITCLFLLTLSAHALVPDTTVDFRDRFLGPINNTYDLFQGPQVAAALASEALCQEKESLCKKRLSSLDLTSCSTDFITPEKTQQMLAGQLGGKEQKEPLETAEKALQCFISQGVCLEKLAPRDPLHALYGCFLRKSQNTGKCPPVEKLYSIYQKYQKNGKNPDCIECQVKQQAQIAESVDSIYQSLLEIAPSFRFNEKELRATIAQGLSWEEFVSQVLVPPSCKEKREKATNIKAVFTERYPQPAKDGAFKASERIIQRMTEQQRAVAIGVCVNPENGKLEGKPGECPHVEFVIANALRQNVKSGKLEVNILSNWGLGNKLQDWQGLDKIADHTFVIHQLE